jgi:hypothetical protein
MLFPSPAHIRAASRFEKIRRFAGYAVNQRSEMEWRAARSVADDMADRW